MKKFALVLCAIALMSWVSTGFAQMSGGGTNQPPPDCGTNQPPPQWGTNQPPPTWGTNQPPPDYTNSPPMCTNLPPVWTNTVPVWTNSPPPNWGTNVPPVCTNGAGGRVIAPKPGAGAPPLPTGVATAVQTFQNNRDQLMIQLKNASDTERAQILNDLETLRQQQQQQLVNMRQQAIDQAQQMQNQFGNSHGDILNQGAAGSSSSSGTGKHR